MAQKILQSLQNTKDKEVIIDVSTVYNNIHSILHFVNKNDPLGGYPANPDNEGQYLNWEYGVQKWNQETFGTLLNPEEEIEDDN